MKYGTFYLIDWDIWIAIGDMMFMVHLTLHKATNLI